MRKELIAGTRPRGGVKRPGKSDAAHRYEGPAKRPEGPLTDVAPYLNRAGHDVLGGYGNTEQKFGAQRGAAYPADRASAVHGPYLAGEMKGKARGHAKPEALFTAGGAASGKSWLTQNRAPDSAIIIDPDRAKHGEGVNGYHGIPEYHGLIATGNMELAASGVHEESSAMSKRLAVEAMNRKSNIVVDGVGDSAPGKFAGKVQAATQAGYSVRVEYMHLATEKALVREAVRAKKKKRKVHEGTLRNGHESSAARMADVAKVPGVDIRIYSSDVPKGTAPKLVASGKGSSRGLSGLSVHDPAAFAEFLDKGGIKGVVKRAGA